jgi:hypothetical protein
MRRAIAPLAAGFALAVMTVIVFAVVRDMPPVSTEGLPPASLAPDCPAGQGAGTQHITRVAGSGFPTAREALGSALATGSSQSVATSEFIGRYVRLGAGGDATLGREFTLVGLDGELEVMALATWQHDGGWLVSIVSHCYEAPPG